MQAENQIDDFSLTVCNQLKVNILTHFQVTTTFEAAKLYKLIFYFVRHTAKVTNKVGQNIFNFSITFRTDFPKSGRKHKTA